MRNVTAETVTDAFAAYAVNAKDERTRTVLTSLAKHLHQFVREVNLSHAEWGAAIDALSWAARITDDKRNEFVLFSDVFGVTSLVDMLGTKPGSTSSSVLGPYHQRGSPDLPNGGDFWKGQEGQVLVVDGTVTDGQTGAPIPFAKLDLWQNADNSLYSAADPEQPDKNYHGNLVTDEQGRFAFTTTLWKPYTVPYDGPVGAMLNALGRNAWRPAHLHVIVEAENYRSVVTELFVEGDEWLDRDAVFAVRPDLVLRMEPSTSVSDVPVKLLAESELPAQFLRTHVELKLVKA